jgi:formylglycine-generating enzyme required for sulfatase activity
MNNASCERNSVRTTRTLGSASAFLVFAVASTAQTPPDYGYRWSTIGNPGNRAASLDELFGSPQTGVGSVVYTYRMATTEVTVGQWFEFVQAYAPYYSGDYRNGEFTGDYIRSLNRNPTGPDDWAVVSDRALNLPSNMSWRYAARYANWLHNGKGTARESFESGAYDTSTFGTNPDGTFTDQVSRSPGARFWIPSKEEWDKAMYYDPNRYGTGVEGYWFYPTMDTYENPPIYGYPGEGGESNAYIAHDDGRIINVGSYPGTTSPWGMLDGSGGLSEWTESAVGFPGRNPEDRSIRGTARGDGSFYHDWLPVTLTSRPDWYLGMGLRLASVPSPATVLVPVACTFVGAVRRRRSCSPVDSSSPL